MLHHAAEGASGMESVAVQNRWVLVATFVLVGLGLLLCAEKASLAKQPARVPDPATPQRSVGPGRAPNAGGRAPVAQSRPAPLRAERPVRGEPTGRPARPRPAGPKPAAAPKADHRSPVARSKPARGRGVRQGPISRPAQRPPAEPGAPHGRGKLAEPPGRQISSLHKPAHAPREHPRGHSRGPQKPVGEDPARPQPQKPVDRGPVSHPDQQPTPRPTPEKPVREPQGNPQGGPHGAEDTGGPKGTGSHGQQQGESGVPPDKVNTHTPGNNGENPPRQSEGHAGLGTTTDNEPDNGGGHLPAAVGKDSEGGATSPEARTTNAPAGGPPSGTGMAQHPDRRAASAALPGQEPGSDTHSTEGPSRQPAKAAADSPAPLPKSTHGEGPVRPAGDSSLPNQQVAGHSRAVEAASPAAGGGRLPAGYGARTASKTPLGSTEYFFGYLWDESVFSVQSDQDGLTSIRDGARGFVPATSHGDTLMQRAPPLPTPSPFSGFGLTMGGAVFSASSSGDGDGPLLAVIIICLSAVLWRGRSRAYGALLRAGTVPRLALERPG
jgi:hypothetical protein